jgi:hypothetical protein
LEGLEVTDQWIEPTESASPVQHGQPPYLAARIYCLGETGMPVRALRGTAEEGPLDLVRVGEFVYHVNTDELELPETLKAQEEQLRAEGRAAYDAFTMFGWPTPADPALVGCYLESKGGHGRPPLPQTVSALLEYGPPLAVTFRDIPVPEELTRARDF